VDGSAHVQHRRAFREFALAEAEPWHREHLTRLYTIWDEFNDRFYAGRLEPPYLLLSVPSNPRRLGDCGIWSGFGGRSQIRIRPSLLDGTHPDVRHGDAYAEGRFRFVADVLIHEQIHQYHQEITGLTDDSYHGHGPAFRDTANEIGAALGLPMVRTCKRRGPERDRPSCSYWPHVVRPDGYYLDAYAPDLAPPGQPSPLVVTLNGDDPVAAGQRLLDALLQIDFDDQLVIYDVLFNWYGPWPDDDKAAWDDEVEAQSR
jgi:hypothetical protein